MRECPQCHHILEPVMGRCPLCDAPMIERGRDITVSGSEQPDDDEDDN